MFKKSFYLTFFFSRFFREAANSTKSAEKRCSDYESGSPPATTSNFPPTSLKSMKQNFPDFSHTINTNFTALQNTKKHLLNNRDESFNYDKFKEIKNKFESFYEVYEEENFSDAAEDLSPAVWAMDCHDGLIILGCCNGRIEIWDAQSGAFKVIIFFSS